MNASISKLHRIFAAATSANVVFLLTPPSMERIDVRESVSSEAELIRNRPSVSETDYGTITNNNEVVLRIESPESNKSPKKSSASRLSPQLPPGASMVRMKEIISSDSSKNIS